MDWYISLNFRSTKQRKQLSGFGAPFWPWSLTVQSSIKPCQELPGGGLSRPSRIAQDDPDRFPRKELWEGSEGVLRGENWWLVFFCCFIIELQGGNTLLRHLQVQKPWKTTAFVVQDLAILSSFICVWRLYVRTTGGAMPINAYSRLQLCKSHHWCCTAWSWKGKRRKCYTAWSRKRRKGKGKEEREGTNPGKKKERERTRNGKGKELWDAPSIDFTALVFVMFNDFFATVFCAS